MASTLNVVTSFVDDHFEIVATILPGGTLPQEIFIYENSGEDFLGPFFGTCSLEELTRLRIFQGTAIKKFSNKYVRYGQAKILVDVESQQQIPSIISSLATNVMSLSKAYSSYTPAIQNISIE